jgi:hypothetical protein
VRKSLLHLTGRPTPLPPATSFEERSSSGFRTRSPFLDLADDVHLEEAVAEFVDAELALRHSAPPFDRRGSHGVGPALLVSGPTYRMGEWHVVEGREGDHVSAGLYLAIAVV